MEQQAQTLPKGWAEAKMMDVAKLIFGQSPPSSTYNKDGIGLPFFQGKSEYGAVYPTARVWCTEPTRTAEKDDVLISVRAPVGPTNLAPSKCAIGRGLAAIRTNIELGYLRYYLKLIENELASKGTGTTFSAITKDILQNQRVVIAPLNEQKRIVDKIEMLFSDLDKGEENLRQVQRLLSSYRQSVLKSAVTGELTRDWQTTEKLPDWQKLCLDEVIISKPRNGYSPKGVDYETPVKNLTLTATTSGTFKPKYFKYVDVQIAEDSHLWLEDGDILIQRANSIEYVGVSAIYRGAKHEFIYPDLMMKVQPNKKLIKSEFLYLILSADITRKYFTSRATGTAGSMPKINQKIVMKTPLLLPSLSEQDILIDKVEDIFSRISTLEAWCETELKRSATLRQSILKSAFSAQLTPQDTADEPASELLKRIAAERATGAKPAIKKPGRSNKRSAA